MKKALFTLISMLLLTQGIAKEKKLPEVTQVISLTELDTELLNELSSGTRPEIAVECEEGTTLPIHFFHSTELFGIGLSPNLTINVQKTCYVRVVKKKGYVSFDLNRWEPASYFFSGKPKVNLEFDREKQSISIKSEMVPYDYDDDEEEWDCCCFE